MNSRVRNSVLFASLLVVAVAAGVWLGRADRGPSHDNPGDRSPATAQRFDAGSDGANREVERASPSAPRAEVPAGPEASLRARHEAAGDLHAFYQDMLTLGGAEANYRAALALHECALLEGVSSRGAGCAATAVTDPFPEKAWACEAAEARCEGFVGRDAQEMAAERDRLYAQAAEQGYERARARQLVNLLEDRPEEADATAAELLAETTDFGTLYHVGAYLQQRLYARQMPWIGGGIREGSDSRPDTQARWGHSAWGLAACRYGQGCEEGSIFMRSACLRGDGCQAGWGYEDYLRYYWSDYDYVRIQAMSEDIYSAMRDRDVDRLLGG